ncbi:MAG: hypothetical protein COT26_02020 [Candidatus Kerfeldbacteria bacterium CG08_land_8_20_14_0_20_43_14]|uniref:EamA domain-containing protein n=1 Tax=Candidatus Kerfeldbacteria bacterium CG08_land_8_20_14_0_20_43_14 TaxID=2014246 RepID=A0A2H0YSF4_9BACT|nr:MAG: hypothetical protein COT26_02020 [Candidatus Kerfeldbacteria bacterium CG08_land_8_20_14_0_20_43_14]
MSWLFFAIAAPFLYGITNFFDKYLIEKRVRNPMLLTFIGGLVAAVIGLVIWLIRGLPGMDFQSAAILIVSGIIFQWALIPYYKALQNEDASRITPLFQVIPVFALILAAIFLGERLYGNQIFGFCVILAGGIVLSLERFGRTMFRLRRSFWLMMLSSLMYTLPFVFFKSVGQPFWNALAFEFFGLGLGSIFLLIPPNSRRKVLAEFPTISGTTWFPILINEVIYIAGKMSTFYATTLVAVSLVTAMAAFQPFFVLLLGTGLTIWFPRVVKENIQKKTLLIKLIATVIIFLGVWYINKS